MSYFQNGKNQFTNKYAIQELKDIIICQIIPPIFFLSGKAEPLNIKSKMPVEIILGNIQIPNECILNTGIFNIISPCTFLTLENDVIALRLYFNNGIIEELEMYNIAGYKINLSMCKSKKRTYIVHERTIKDRLTIKSQ